MNHLKRICLPVIIMACLFCAVCCKKNGDSGGSTDDDNVVVKYIDTLSPTTPMKHEGGLNTQADFTRIRQKVSAQAEPWFSGWQKLVANSHAQTSYVANPTVKLVRGGNSAEEPDPDNYSRAMNDAHAAYQLALRWKISTDTIYARTAVTILNAWANTCTKLSGNSNVALGAGIYGYAFAVAGELLRDFPGWQAADFTKFKQWMLNVWYPINYSFLSGHFGCHPEHAWSNWDLCNMASAMAIGILTDNRSIYNYVINYYQRGLGNGNNYKTIFHVFPGADSTMAEMQESGRDQGHCTLSLALLTTICQLAWNQGDDLWGFRNNIVLKASEYVARYNVANLSVPYYQYSWHEGDPWNGCGVKTTLLPEIGSGGRGTMRPMWAMIYNHYAKIKKVPQLNTTYTALGVQKAQPEGGGGDYGPNSGGFDQLGFGTLLYSLE
ncbi:cell wall anchor protein [Niastella caeni]|uniref:Cell wall anchor protein n=1 Tax=Niastella caeni TaxID=2569763 RepID=A0A4V4H1L9_9BACT|nr:alginate lyase family protein [Niastella caeni]THU41076.1 cell wall anchor protein [Niastella caeni]